jgi:hypothetical protein
MANDSRQLKIFSLAPIAGPLTRIHVDPHLRSGRASQKNRSQKKTRSYWLFVRFCTNSMAHAIGKGRTCV